jgi:hypothetical protein
VTVSFGYINSPPKSTFFEINIKSYVNVPDEFYVIQTLMLIAYAATASLNFYRLILLPVENRLLFKNNN